MSLLPNDINFLEKYTQLSADKLLPLIEQEDDLNLVLESISHHGFSKEELFGLSFLTFIKILVYKYSRDTKFDLLEKTYIANTILKYFPKLQIRINFGYLAVADTSEKLSQYYLILIGFFYKRLKYNILDDVTLNRIHDGFKSGGCPKISSHFNEWVKILNRIEADNWFLTSAKIKTVKKQIELATA